MPGTRRPLVSGNWKMHHNHFEAIQMVQKLAYILNPADHDVVDVSVHPPFTDIRSVQTVIESDEMRLVLGAQHCHFEESGAFTGEVSPGMLAKLNVALVIVGHSERREVFGETDDDVRLKAAAVLANGMTPIFCCGETREEREAGGTDAKVTGQVKAGLAGLSQEQVAGLVIAYEPIWAIGTGLTATPRGCPGGLPGRTGGGGRGVGTVGGRLGAYPVRGVCQAGQRPGPDDAARHRRPPGGRCLARP